MIRRSERRDPIAIVGIGCRLPGGIGSPRQFWEFLLRRGDAIAEVPEDRWSADALFAADPAAKGRTYARRGGFLRDIDQFDPEFFAISPREAAHIDPQQRLLLETAHEAMEDAGERWEAVPIRNTGVFVGLFIHDYQHMQFAEREALGPHSGTGTSMSIAANRISYAFDLRGPSMAIDTACSSSLVAVDLACKAILNGECDYALAGGANVILKPDMTIAMSKATMLSPDGYCRSFDARANGYVRSEGAALVVLRRLSTALACGNRVYATILGSGVNSDGQTKGISVPSGEAQERLTRSVLEQAGVPAHTVGYVEAHGTGTPVGDPIEAGALGRVFSIGRRGDDACLLGSVKSNIGHLESASGVTGLIKAALCLHHEQIPPNLHFEQPNPAIDFEALKLRVVCDWHPWPANGTPRRAAVNSFGFGGTNAHVLLEEAPQTKAPQSEGELATSDAPLARRLILPLGAHDAAAVRGLAASYARALSEGCDVGDLLYTVSQRRSHGRFRAAFVASNADELQQQLVAFAEGNTPAGASFGERHEAFDGKPVFVFSGMGSQWWAMGRELLRDQPVFRSEVERVDACMRRLTGWSVIEHLLADEADSRIRDTDVAQPALFAIQCGLSALFAHFGVEPIATMGHSVGEAAALHAAGVLTLEDAATVICQRSRLQRTTAGFGGMLAAGIDPRTAAELMKGLETRVSIAAINSPRSVTLSGDTEELLRLRTELETQGKFARMLDVEVPYHSARMDPIQRELVDSLSAIRPQPAKIAYYSTADGGRAQDTLGDAAYWWRNVRMPVVFAEAMAAATRDGHACFFEIGPHPVLGPSMRECLEQQRAPAAVVASLRRNRSDLDTVATALAELHVAGATISWDRVLAPGRLVSLEPYPFQRSRHWSESEQAERQRKGLSTASNLRTSGQRHPLLGERLTVPTPSWIGTLRLDDHAYLADHRVQGAVVFPGTGYLEMALQTLAEADEGAGPVFQDDEVLVLGEVEIGRALYLAPQIETRLETRRANERWEIHGYTEQDASWVRHASGKCRREKRRTSHEPLDLEAVRARCSSVLPADYAYRLFHDVGLEYGPAFQAIEDLFYGPRESLARVALPAALADDGAVREPRFLFHPALLDACLHTLFGALNLNGEDSHRRGNVFLPVSVRKLCIYRRPSPTLWSHARLHTVESRHFAADIRIYDQDGALVADVVDLRCEALEHPASIAEKRRREWLLEYAWSASESPTKASLGGRWLVLAPTPDCAVVTSLRDSGANCVVAVPGASFACVDGVYRVALESRTDFECLLTSVTRTGEPLAGVVHALCLDADGDQPCAAPAQQITGAGSLMHLVQVLAVLGDDASATHSDAPLQPRLWVLTDGVQPVRAGDPIRLPHSTVWGLRRVIANEHPALSARIVDLDGTPASYTALAGELARDSNDDEIAFRDGVRFVHRLKRYLPDTTARSVSEGVTSGSIELEIGKIGDLKSLGFVPLPALELGPQEVEIAVEAAGVNFKDVMKATGLFPARLLAGNLWSRETLGMECAGRISRIGAQVHGLRPGDRVMALAPRSFASHTITHAALVVPNPSLSPGIAAGIPVAFLTAAMGLEELARLAPGERVLIHAASGGVGLAAIQIAQDIGAEVFATAGSEDKRQLVRALGVEHVFDSRSVAFAEEIRAATRGEGVDVVLNSLAGEAIAHGVGLLRDYGRFIEIGKMDLDRDFALGLRPFTRCLSFHALDLDRLLAQRVEACGRVLRSLQTRLAEGRLRPLPVTVYRAGQVAEAFHEMAAARHTGKLVIDLASAGVPVRASLGTRFRSDATYLVTGGLGGFGLQLARFLAARGAGRLLLLGRRGAATPHAERARSELEALGAEVQIEACDVADGASLAQVLGRMPAEKPLRGVFHAAAVLDDALLKNLDLARYERTYLPKAAGAWNLHEQTLDCPLDHFMCFSSMASVLGNQGSANYCAANAFVDSLAHHRRRNGLPALTVNWGVIADVGMAADEDFYRQNLERNGLKTIHSDHCLELLDLLLQLGRTQTTVCPIDFETWLRFNPAGREGRLSELLAEAGRKVETVRSRSNEENALREELDALEPEARVAAARRAIQTVLARVFRTEPDKIDARRSLTALGADSLMAIEIKNRLEALGVAISVTQLLNRNSVTTLANDLLDTLGYGASTPEPSGREETIQTETAASSWLLRRAPRDDARMRLVCFPYAGGGPSVYHHWAAALPSFVEVIAVNLPGRGARLGERPIESIAQVADAIVPELLPLLDRPFALFGHCMGAIVMHEVAARLNHEHGKAAAHIFASGCMAPHLYNSPIVHEQDDDRFLDVLRLISFSGTRALIEDPELRSVTFPMLRADFRAVVEYGERFTARAPLDSPITGLAADNDLFAAPKAMEAWSSYTSRGYDLAELSGDHYFVESDRDRVINIVSARLTALDASAPAIAGVAWRKPDNGTLGRPPRKSRSADHGDGSQRVPNNHANPQPGEDAGPVRVFCFPPTGFGAGEFPKPSADHDLAYEPVELRRCSAPVRSVAEMVSIAYAAIRSRLASRTIFYGHCLGAIVAYELARLLQKEGLAAPEHLLVAGTVGPHLYVAPDAHKLPEQKLLELLGVLGYPFAGRLNEDASFRRERLAMIRADLEAMATYQYREGPSIEAPITAISLRHDLWSYPLRTSSWRHHSEARFELVEWEGDHYHNLRNPEGVRALVRSLAFQSDVRRRAPHPVGEQHELCA